MSLNFSSLWRRAEEACDAGIDALSSIASSSSVPLLASLASAADAARDALAPLRQPLAEGGWPRGHRVELGGSRFTVEGLVSSVGLISERHSIDDDERKKKKTLPPQPFLLDHQPQLGEGGFACVYAVKREGGNESTKQQLFALKRVIASSRECLEGARREVAAARAAAATGSSSSSASVAIAVGLLPLLASEERQADDKRTIEVLLLFPFCAGGSLADAVEARNRNRNGENGNGKGGEEKQTQILSVAPLLRLFADVAEGLSRLHEAKLGHFDVKPHNIFLLLEEEDGEGEEQGEKRGAGFSPPPPRLPFRALLGDWGSARAIPVPFSSHAEGLAICEEAERATTAAYRPPELWDPLHFAAASAATASASPGPPRRRQREVSGATDVWSLGACLFACLAGDGRSPSEVAAGAGGGGSLALAACGSGRIEWPPPSSSSSSSSLPSFSSAAVKALVERCLSLDPEERPSAAAFAAEARALAEGIEKERGR